MLIQSKRSRTHRTWDSRADLPAETGTVDVPAQRSGEPDPLRRSLVRGLRQREAADVVRGGTPADDDTADEALARAHWQHYWDCLPCSYPDRTGDLRSVIKIADFYSARQWHSTGMYSDLYQPQGIEHELMLTLPAGPGKPPGPGRTLRLFLFRGPGTDFSEADRALLTLLRPHLHYAHLDAERRRHPLPSSLPDTGNCWPCSPPGTPTPRSPGASAYPRAPSACTWKTSTAGCKSPTAQPQSPAPSQTGTHTSFMGLPRAPTSGWGERRPPWDAAPRHGHDRLAAAPRGITSHVSTARLLMATDTTLALQTDGFSGRSTTPRRR